MPRDLLQAMREIFLHEQVTGLRCLAVRQEQPGKSRPIGQFLFTEGCPEQLRARDRKTALRINDCRLQQRGEASGFTFIARPMLAGIVVSLTPGIHRACADDRRLRATRRDRLFIVWQLLSGLPQPEQNRVAALCVRDHPDRVAADAAEVRIGHGDHRTHRNRSLDRVTALAEDFGACFARKRVRARHHSGPRLRQPRIVGSRGWRQWASRHAPSAVCFQRLLGKPCHCLILSVAGPLTTRLP
ncbi:hypothetical protein BN961_02227 [Afipia felis]|uniref:Uncharacterized protein n=1 Tax=Afipia felis TaxID=1035 RepID=A0A090N7L4_AFIFE|nr:hypothetical protein BN961_02227 [Afipia felis]